MYYSIEELGLTADLNLIVDRTSIWGWTIAQVTKTLSSCCHHLLWVRLLRKHV